MTKTGPRDDPKLAAIKLEWWPRSDWNRWPPSLESAMIRKPLRSTVKTTTPWSPPIAYFTRSTIRLTVMFRHESPVVIVIGRRLPLGHSCLSSPSESGATWQRYTAAEAAPRWRHVDALPDQLHAGCWGHIRSGDVRSVAGYPADILLNPLTYLPPSGAVQAANYGGLAIRSVDERVGLLDTADNVKKTALDPYATFRILYRQHHDAEIEATRADKGATIPISDSAAEQLNEQLGSGEESQPGFER